MSKRSILEPAGTGSVSVHAVEVDARELKGRRIGNSQRRGRAASAAFMRPLAPTGPLAAIVGRKALTRTEVTARIWDYVKKNKLQDTVHVRTINADEKLKALFGKSQASMFELSKAASKYLK